MTVQMFDVQAVEVVVDPISHLPSRRAVTGCLFVKYSTVY